MAIAINWSSLEQLGAVGRDVFPNEPEVNRRLLVFQNVTLLPCMGAETKDAQKAMEVRALTNLRDFLTAGMRQDLVREYGVTSKL
jgi:glyoxylate reductase